MTLWWVMLSHAPCPESYCENAATTSFLERFCLRFLRDAQNPDGGWGYRPAGHSGVEPTCWAVMALAGLAEFEQSRRRGTDWLFAAQLPNGSWPAFAGQSEGCWVTPLACLALHEHGVAPEAVTRGLDWLLNTWPRKIGLFWRVRDRVFQSRRVARQNNALRGWSWTPGTGSWVEPTAYALMLLQNLFPGAPPRRVVRRQQMAEAMLYDRMCPGGGWNSGNPSVYGVDGEPLIGPTVWALLALRSHPERAGNQKGLDWLARAYEQAQGPGSLALAHICLKSYGRFTRPLEPTMRRLYEADRFLKDVPVTAFAAMALDPAGGWLRRAASGEFSR